MSLPTATTNLEFEHATAAAQVAQALEGQMLVVTDKQVRVVEEAPPRPYTTLDLLEDAALQWSWSGRKTMAAAQVLFEQGFITYPRTDATEVDPEAVQMAQTVVLDLYGKKALPESSNGLLARFRPWHQNDVPTPEAQEEAHEAIRPTDPGCTPGELDDYPPDTVTLYRLIWRRFLAAQMRPARYQIIEVTFKRSP